jgi:hypothetical protein
LIQRTQSVFILFSALISFIAAIFFHWTCDSLIIGINLKCIFFSTLILCGLLSIATLLLFKKRKIQVLLNKIVILFSTLLIALLFYLLLMLPGEYVDSEKGVLVFFLLIVLFSSVTANRYIKKDQQLVKSIDRLR